MSPKNKSTQPTSMHRSAIVNDNEYEQKTGQASPSARRGLNALFGANFRREARGYGRDRTRAHTGPDIHQP